MATLLAIMDCDDISPIAQHTANNELQWTGQAGGGQIEPIDSQRSTGYSAMNQRKQIQYSSIQNVRSD